MKSGLARRRWHLGIRAVRAAVIVAVVVSVSVLVSVHASPARAGDTSPTASTGAIVDAAPTCDDARQHCIEIRLHVAGLPDTGPVADPVWVTAQLAAANRHFAPLGVGFQLAGVDVLPPRTAHLRTRADRTALATYLGGPVIHLFVPQRLENVDDPTVPVQGVAWRKGARKYLIVSATAMEHVLAHELGHFFGLPHSTDPISIMNKTRRDEPPLDQRTFAAAEIVKMRAVLERLLRDGVIATVKARRS